MKLGKYHCRLLVLLASAQAACSGDEGQGEVVFSIWGEEYIEDSIPSAEFEDGYRVQYDKFLIVVGDVSVAGGGSRETIEGTWLYDLTISGPHELGQLEGLASGSWPEVSYRNPPADEDTQRHASASAADLEHMVAGEYSLYVEGTARSEDDEVFSFAWGFSRSVEYADCVDVRGGQETDGLVVGDGTVDEHQLTIHGDHLFYDDLASPEARLRFAPLAAADVDGDREVTLEELDAVRLASLPAEAGSYGVGAYDIDSLGDFMRAATQSVGHFNGEGHCSVHLD